MNVWLRAGAYLHGTLSRTFASGAVVLEELDLLTPRRADLTVLDLALVIPLHGSAGIFGPSVRTARGARSSDGKAAT